jgi:ubiquitin C-terminal hydrolase
LDLFVKADVLDGENKYFCEDVNKKIDVQKRCYFKKLPNTFIIHLKRFEFDFNTMLRIKVNDYFEFPLEFNMFKWTRDHLVEAKEL